MTAASTESAHAQLVARGSQVLSVARRWSWPHLHQENFDVAAWCRELEVLLRAGMSAVEAIETLAASSFGVSRRDVHDRLLRTLEQGAALSLAMRSSGFPEVLVASVMASERTSTLPEALRDYLKYDELLQRLRRQAVSAALYPAVVVALGAVVSLFLLLYVMPRFATMYGSFQGQVSLPTATVLELSRVMRDSAGLFVLALGALAAAFIAALQSGRLQEASTAVIEAMPLTRRYSNHFRLAQAYQALALLFRGGYSLEEALNVCAGLNLGGRATDQLQSARGAVARGKSASAAMAHAGLTDVTSERLLAAGERTGDFAGVLQAVADRHAQFFMLFMERSTKLLEPLLLLAVAAVVGGLVVMMYLPIFDIAGGLGARR